MSAAAALFSVRGSATIAAALAGGAAFAWYINRHRHRHYFSSLVGLFRRSNRLSSGGAVPGAEVGPDGKKLKVAVDKDFVRRLKLLLSIVVPGFRSKELWLLVLHTGFLISRTFLSIYIASLDGSIVKSIVDRDAYVFMYRMLRWIAIAVPATYVNSMIR